MTNRTVVKEWQDYVLEHWLFHSRPREFPPMIEKDLQTLEREMQSGKLDAVRKLTGKLIRTAEKACDHNYCADVRMYCARAMICLKDDNSALQLLQEAQRNYMCKHDKALAMWMLGCLHSLRKSRTDQAMQLLCDCSRQYARIADDCVALLDHFHGTAPGSNDLEKYKEQIRESIWYKSRYQEMTGVIKWLKEVDTLPSPMHLARLYDFPVLVIGTAGEDIVACYPDGSSPNAPNLCRIVRSPGGVALNVAINLAKLGQPVRLIAAIGADATGNHLVQQIQGSGIDTSAILRVQNQPTDTYLAVINHLGERSSAYYHMECAQDITPEILSANDQLFRGISSVFFDANLSIDTIQTAISLARQAKVPIFADPVTTALSPRLRPHLADVELLVANRSEAEALVDSPANAVHQIPGVQIAAQIVSEGVGNVVLWLPGSNFGYATDHDCGQFSANNTNTTDPTGGRDAMTATLIYALRRNIPLIDAIRLGISAATLTKRYHGTIYPDLTLDKIIDHLVI